MRDQIRACFLVCNHCISHVWVARQAETDSKSAPSDLRKQPNAVTSTAKSTGTKSAGTSLQRPHTAEAGFRVHTLELLASRSACLVLDCLLCHLLCLFA